MVPVLSFSVTPVTVPPEEVTERLVLDVRNVALFRLMPYPPREKLLHSKLPALSADTYRLKVNFVSLQLDL